MKKDEKSHAGKATGAGVGGFVGYCIGGVGLAAGGTAIGVPVLVVGATCAAVGALIGGLFD